MADIIDTANDLRDAELEARLKNRPSAEIPTGTGECLYCGEALQNPQHRWCDQHCRDDYERAERAAKNRPVSGE